MADKSKELEKDVKKITTTASSGKKGDGNNTCQKAEKLNVNLGTIKKTPNANKTELKVPSTESTKLLSARDRRLQYDSTIRRRRRSRYSESKDDDNQTINERNETEGKGAKNRTTNNQNKLKKDTQKFRDTEEIRIAESNIITTLQAVNKKDDDHYRIRHGNNLKGNKKVVVFSHNEFTSAQDPRVGNLLDVERIQNVFEKKLNFEVIIHNDKAKDEVIDEIKKLSEEDHSDRDILIIFVLTHGDERYLHASNLKYEPSLLWEDFEADKCQTLAGKPKIYIINACHGNQVQKGVRMLQSQIETDSAQCVPSYILPSHADFLFARSSVEGSFTFRYTEKGSIFIQTFCDVVEEYCNSKHLMEILQITMRKVATNSIEEGTENDSEPLNPNKMAVQMPFVITRLLRNVYLAEQTG